MLVLTTILTLSCAGPPVLPLPLAVPEELSELYASGAPFDVWVHGVQNRETLWSENWANASVPRDVTDRARALRGPWRFLVVAADTCQDSAWNIPALARLAADVPSLELRVVGPDVGQEVMDARPTPDGRAATPTVVILDDDGVEAGCWIERPARQRDFYLENLKGVERGSDEYRAAVGDFLGWYRDDAGASALREIVTLVEAAESGARGCEASG